MADDDQKTELDMDSKDVLESQVDESTEESQEPVKQNTQQPEHVETVVIKKGGFISFLSFVLSLAALGASAYLYLESQKPKQQEPIKVDVNQWKKPLADLDSKLNKDIQQLKSQLNQSKQQNDSMLVQLSQLKTTMSEAKPLELSHEPTNVLYDEDTFSRKVKELEDQIQQNKQRYETVSTELTNTNNSQKKELTRLQSFFANQKAKQTNQGSANKNPNEFKFEMAENLLQAAMIQLDVHNNLNRTNQLLKEASSQVKQIPGQTYTNFAFEIEQTVQTLNNIETVDSEATSQQINTLKTQASNLEFESAKVEEQKDGSWFDKLVVIRKIEDDDVQKLTAAEQMVVMSQLNNSFDMLNFALLSQNQMKWDASIQQIEQALKKYFANNSVELQAQLSLFAEMKLNTKYPSLSSLLKTFEQYRSSSKPFSKE
jgi:uncharacterized protein HemX